MAESKGHDAMHEAQAAAEADTADPEKGAAKREHAFSKRHYERGSEYARRREFAKAEALLETQKDSEEMQATLRTLVGKQSATILCGQAGSCAAVCMLQRLTDSHALGAKGIR